MGRCIGPRRRPTIAPDFEEQFQALIDEHKRILYKVCNLYCKSRAEREDLAQEIVLQLWRSFGKFDERSRFSTWMFRISLNVAISFCGCETTRTRHVLSTAGFLADLAAFEDETREPEN